MEARRYFTVTVVGFSFLNSFSMLRIVMNMWLRNNTDKQWSNLRFIKEVNGNFWLLWRSLHGEMAFFGVLFTISHGDWPGSHCFLTLLNFLYYLERKGSKPSIFFLKRKKKKGRWEVVAMVQCSWSAKELHFAIFSQRLDTNMQILKEEWKLHVKEFLWNKHFLNKKCV